MSDTNITVLIGRLTRDSELKYTNNGTAVLNFSIAVNRSIPPKGDGCEWKNEASFFDVQAWAKLAEAKAPSLVKGKQILVEGELRQDRWEQDGQSRSKVYVVAHDIKPLADPKPAHSATQTDSPDAGHGEARADAPAPWDSRPADVFDDDIPF